VYIPYGEGEEDKYSDWKSFAPEKKELAAIAASQLSNNDFISCGNMKDGFEVPR
jgi:hypothetical protein